MSVHADPPPPLVPEATRYAYKTGSQLGKGGFAICHRAELLDEGRSTGKLYALKIVRSKMEPPKLAQKFVTELQLHSKLHHPNIVHFHRAFSYQASTYVVLEMCPNGSLADALKVRKSFTMPEIRRFIIQICGAIKYLHFRNIVHRDLKTGNLFLDSDMNIKVGDFGLAAVLMTSNELGQQRRTTMCGTPNYLAPEILEKGGKGHNEKVDLWAIGIIAYTLAVGKAPFHAPKREDIYKKLKERDYSWPALTKITNDISNDLRDLVASLLVHEDERPTPDEIVSHAFFKMGYVPESLTTAILTKAPTWKGFNKPPTSRDIARGYSDSWYDVCKASGVGICKPGDKFEIVGGIRNIRSVVRDCDQEIKLGLNPVVPVPSDKVYLPYPARKGWPYEDVAKVELSDIVEEESSQEGNQLLEISVNPQKTSQKPRRLEEQARRSGGSTKENAEPKADVRVMPPPTLPRKRSVKSKKEGKEGVLEIRVKAVDVPEEKLARRAVSRPAKTVTSTLQKEEVAQATERRVVSRPRREERALSPKESTPTPELGSDEELRIIAERPAPITRDANLVPYSDPETVLARVAKLRDNIAKALSGKSSSGRKPTNPPQLPFVSKWVDYSKKQGIGYVLSDGSIGCCFLATERLPVTHLVVRDGVKHLHRLTASPTELSGLPVEYYESHEDVGLKRRPLKDLDAIRSKSTVVMWTKFAKYLSKLGTQDPEPASKGRARNFARLYHRLGNVGVFGFDDGAFQFNFPDHTKIVLSPDGRHVSFTHLPASAAQRLSLDGELNWRAVKDRAVMNAPLHTLLHGSSSREDMEMKIVAKANRLREKMEYVLQLADAWVRHGGLGRLGEEELSGLRYRGPQVEEGRNTWEYVTVGRDGGDVRCSLEEE